MGGIITFDYSKAIGFLEEHEVSNMKRTIVRLNILLLMVL